MSNSTKYSLNMTQLILSSPADNSHTTSESIESAELIQSTTSTISTTSTTISKTNIISTVEDDAFKLHYCGNILIGLESCLSKDDTIMFNSIIDDVIPLYLQTISNKSQNGNENGNEIKIEYSTSYDTKESDGKIFSNLSLFIYLFIC